MPRSVLSIFGYRRKAQGPHLFPRRAVGERATTPSLSFVLGEGAWIFGQRMENESRIRRHLRVLIPRIPLVVSPARLIGDTLGGSFWEMASGFSHSRWVHRSCALSLQVSTVRSGAIEPEPCRPAASPEHAALKEGRPSESTSLATRPQPLKHSAQCQCDH